MKESLIKEFGTKLSSLEVHRRLANRRKRYNESFREYLYCLQEIAKPVQMDDESIIDYFIQVMKDTTTNKTILYQAKNLIDLKEKLKTYEKIRKISAIVHRQ